MTIKAMLVEPSRVYHQLLGNMLRDLGFDLTIVTTAKQALAASAETKFNVICVAMYLEDMQGGELCKKIRESRYGKRMPIIMITSEASAQSRAGSMEMGVTEIFHKSDLEAIANFFRDFIRNYLSHEAIDGNVLYIEDSLAIAARVKVVLHDMGLHVDHFTSAEEALQAIESKQYDLILTDVVLAGQMSGFGLVRAVRDMEGRNRSIPILAMTGFDDTSRRIELLRAGVSDYVIKPFVEEELVIRVRNHLMNRRLLNKIEEQQLHMQELALKDGLTSLYNRHFLAEMAPKKIYEAHRHCIPLSLIILDVDNFKSINDQYGHLQGDEVLSCIADILRESCRKEDFAARLGGDEFLLMLSHCDLAGGYKKALSLCEAVTRRLQSAPKVTVSVGVSSLPTGTECDFTKLFSAADQAVYLAKQAGKGRVAKNPLNTP